MDFNSFMKSYADEIGGNYSEYDSTKSVIIVPLKDGRFQSVVGLIKTSEKFNNRLGIEFSSKVCEVSDKLDFKSMLEENSRLCHSKLAINDDFIVVEAATFTETATEDLLKDIIQEVATQADEWEFRITGLDVH